MQGQLRDPLERQPAHHSASAGSYTELMRHWKILCFAFASAWLLGCGQTGPLYLPDRGGEQVQPEQQPTSPSPESQRDRKTKPGTEDVPATDTQTPAPLPDPSAPTPTPPGN